ncbi:hypothetical protein [Nonomuraea sp. B19D2]|uniref:hypothetical protein n=1 Tax=Nonomuraea sp. B19D2 TaxID=3159561 RepID=UPI0032DAB16F
MTAFGAERDSVGSGAICRSGSDHGRRDGTDMVDLVVQGGLLDLEQATALLTSVPPNSALLAGG